MRKKGIVYLVSFAAFFGPLTQSIYTPLVLDVQHQFDASPLLVNLTISIFTFVLALMQIIYGPLTDRFGRKKLLIPGILLYIVASLGAALSASIEWFMAFRILQATGIAVGSVVATTVIADLYRASERGRPMGTFQMIVALGPVIGPAAGGYIGGMFGFHSVFWVLAIAGFLLLITTFLSMKETKPDNVAAEPFRLRTFLRVFAIPAGAAIMVIAAVQYYTFYNYLVFLPEILSEYYQLTSSQNGVAFLPMTVSLIIGSFLGGRMQEKVNPSRLLIWMTSLNIVATLLFAVIYSFSLPLLLISITLFGLFVGMSLPVQTTLLTIEFQNMRGTAIGVYNFSRYIGMGIGPILGTFLYQYGPWVPFVFAAALFAMAVLLGIRKFWGK